MNARTLLPFDLGSKKLVVDAHLVREIIGSVRTMDVPRADSLVPSVFLWKGRAVPLIRLERCLSLSDSSDLHPRTLVLHVMGEIVGMGVDAVGEVVTVLGERLLEARIEGIPFGMAELETESTLATLLDLPGLVAEVLEANVSQMNGD